jgi:hypothetical protein
VGYFQLSTPGAHNNSKIIFSSASADASKAQISSGRCAATTWGKRNGERVAPIGGWGNEHESRVNLLA